MMQWFGQDHVLFGTWHLLEKVPSKSISTVAISTKSKRVHLKYNPNFICSLSMERLELVLLSEVLKVLLRHPTTRLLNPPVVSNMASKVTINECLNRTPMKTINQKNNAEVESLFRSLELSHGKCFEEYFRNIIDEVPNKDTVDYLKNMFPLEDLKKSEEGYSEFDSEEDAMKEYNNPFNGSTNEWTQNDDWDEAIKSHIELCSRSGKNFGNITGNLESDILAASKSQVNYKTLLASFANSIRKSETYRTRMKYNRRFGLESPGVRHRETSHILVAIDASLSMSDQRISEGYGVVNHLCRHSKLSYLIFDTEIKHIEKNFKKTKKVFKVYGRGGTCVQAVIDYAETQKIDGLIIFTDGYLEKTTKPKKTKVLWLLTEDHPKDAFGYGKQVYLNKFYKR